MNDIAGKTPRRIQLSRRKGFRLPPNAVSVARPTVFGNPITCSHPYSCPHSPLFERRAWELDDGSVSPYRCCTDAYRHYVETGLTGEPTSLGYFNIGLDAMLGYPRRARLIAALPRLRGHDLACWCALDRRCHADILLEIANRP